jgi:small subunit ribosomal protein S23
MGRHKKGSALHVAQQAKFLLDNKLLPREPIWYQPVIRIPPMTDYSRKPHNALQGRPKDKRTDVVDVKALPGGMEAHFRKRFYKEHPWELARPRILVEEDGANYLRMDWSKIQQLGKPLDGERYTYN